MVAQMRRRVTGQQVTRGVAEGVWYVNNAPLGPRNPTGAILDWMLTRTAEIAIGDGTDPAPVFLISPDNRGE
jgi:hypothetical protein